MNNVNTNVYVKSYINYNDLLNKPTINNIELVGNLSLTDLDIQKILTAGTSISIDDSLISVLVDDALSSYSENPVQNRIIKEALDAKQDSLNNVQLEAVNSGITILKVRDYDNHLVNTSNPHNVTKAQVGLGNCDNTSDLNKPISTATQTALDGKQSTLTETQLIAVNSGIDSTKTGQITTNANDIADIQAKIPTQATSENQLADKAFVNSSIATNTGNFVGTFASIEALNSYTGTVTNNDYAFVINRVVTNNGADWSTFNALNSYNKALLTNFDYGWVINGAKFDLYRFDIVEQTWDLRAENIGKDEVSLNIAYNRYKATIVENIVSWDYEYTLNNSSFTAAQWRAVNSGITSDLVAQITTNQENITSLQNNKLDITTAASTYLPLAGGTITGNLTINNTKVLDVKTIQSSAVDVIKENGTAVIVGNSTESLTLTAKDGNSLQAKLGNDTYKVMTAADKGVASGIAPLDSTTKVPVTNLPMDTVLDATSENPVQNKVIYAAIGDVETLLHNLNSGDYNE